MPEGQTMKIFQEKICTFNFLLTSIDSLKLGMGMIKDRQAVGHAH